MKDNEPKLMKLPYSSIIACCFVLAFCGRTVQAGVAYEFTKVADTSGPIATLFTPAINSSGQVAYWARGGGDFIYRWAGGALTEIARDGDSAPGRPNLNSLGPRLSLNDAGTVAFNGSYTFGGSAIGEWWRTGRSRDRLHDLFG